MEVVAGTSPHEFTHGKSPYQQNNNNGPRPAIVMSFDPTLTLTGNSASSHVYAAISYDKNKIIRRDNSTGLGQPQDLTISHSESKVGGALYDRHLIRLDRTRVNSEGVAATGSVYVVISSPRSGIVTAADIADMVTQLEGFFDATSVAKLLNSEP